MYYLNKIVGAFLNPLGIGLLLLMATVVFSWLRKGLGGVGKLSKLSLLLAFLWLWIWSTGAMGRWIGLSLEKEFPPQTAEKMPNADAIVVLGGGAGLNTNACPYVKLMGSADRAWHGARLYKAGKAPKVFVTCEADSQILKDLGVPQEIIVVGGSARNTEEEAKLFATRGIKKILLVTSAWHMRRARLMYERYAKGVEVVPAATDHMNMYLFGQPLSFQDFIPDQNMLAQNSYMFKEWLAYYGYYFLRK